MVEVRSAPGGAEQNEPAPWVGSTSGVVGELGEAPQRPELGPGQRVRVLGAQKVRAGGGPDDQGPAGEHGSRLVAVGEQVGHVLVGVARGRPAPQGQATQVDLGAVDQPEVVEAPAPLGGADDPGAVAARQRGSRRTGSRRAGASRPRTPPEPVRRGGGIERSQVERGVHGQGPPIAQIDEVGLVTQPLVQQRQDRRAGSSTVGGVGGEHRRYGTTRNYGITPQTGAQGRAF